MIIKGHYEGLHSRPELIGLGEWFRSGECQDAWGSLPGWTRGFALNAQISASTSKKVKSTGTLVIMSVIQNTQTDEISQISHAVT